MESFNDPTHLQFFRRSGGFARRSAGRGPREPPEPREHWDRLSGTFAPRQSLYGRARTHRGPVPLTGPDSRRLPRAIYAGWGFVAVFYGSHEFIGSLGDG